MACWTTPFTPRVRPVGRCLRCGRGFLRRSFRQPSQRFTRENHRSSCNSRPPLAMSQGFPATPIVPSHLTEGRLGFAPRYTQNPSWWLATHTPDGHSERLGTPMTAVVSGQPSDKPTTRLTPLCSSGSLGGFAPKVTSIGTESNRQPPAYKTGVLPLNYRCVAKGLSRAFADGGLCRIPTRPVRTGVLGSVSPLASLPRFGHGATILRPDLA